MEALLGFTIGFWDYVTFLVLFVLVAAGLALAVIVLGLPGRIAIARNHPDAEAVYLMGWIGFLAQVNLLHSHSKATPNDSILPNSKRRSRGPILGAWQDFLHSHSKASPNESILRV